MKQESGSSEQHDSFEADTLSPRDALAPRSHDLCRQVLLGGVLLVQWPRPPPGRAASFAPELFRIATPARCGAGQLARARSRESPPPRSAWPAIRCLLPSTSRPPFPDAPFPASAPRSRLSARTAMRRTSPQSPRPHADPLLPPLSAVGHRGHADKGDGPPTNTGILSTKTAMLQRKVCCSDHLQHSCSSSRVKHLPPAFAGAATTWSAMRMVGWSPCWAVPLTSSSTGCLLVLLLLLALVVVLLPPLANQTTDTDEDDATSSITTSTTRIMCPIWLRFARGPAFVTTLTASYIKPALAG